MQLDKMIRAEINAETVLMVKFLYGKSNNNLFAWPDTLSKCLTGESIQNRRENVRSETMTLLRSST